MELIHMFIIVKFVTEFVSEQNILVLYLHVVLRTTIGKLPYAKTQSHAASLGPFL